MDDAHQIVLEALEQAGVALPPGVDAVQDVTSSALVSISSKALALIRGAGTPSLSASLPQSMSERFRICNDLATAIKELGYRGDLSFHQFLYPSEEDTHKLLRFLLDNLSKSSSSLKGRGSRKGRGSKFAGEGITISKTLTTVRHALSTWLEEANQNVNDERSNAVVQQGKDSALRDSNQDQDSTVTVRHPFRTCPLRLASSTTISGKKSPALITLQAKPKGRLIPSVLELNAKNALCAARVLDDQLAHLSRRADDAAAEDIGDVRLVSKGSLQVSTRDGVAYAGGTSSSLLRAARFREERDMVLLQEHGMQGDAKGNKLKNLGQESDLDTPEAQEDLRQRELTRLAEKLSSLTIDGTKLTREAGVLKQDVKGLERDLEASSEESASLEEKHLLLKVAVDMALDSSVSTDSKVQKLQLSIQASQQQLASLKSEWETLCKHLEEKQISLETSAQSSKEELQSKLKQVKEIRQQIKDMNAKIRHREEQCATFSMELENAPKGALRNTYVRRITELIKNSKKQDSDISRIISEMRDLQRESNANQGRLRRTHALVDELVFRDAKKDPVCRQAYRLLSSIHENFADCYEKVFTVDKVRREIVELQATLEALEKWPVDLKKVQADIDAIVAENRALENNLQSSTAVGNSKVTKA